jgi:O-antigen/teichoic acid export membrane protein
MFRKVAGTVVTRFLTAVLMLAVVILNTNFLGAEKVGVISLIVLAATIIQMVHGFIGGASLVYFVPRAPMTLLFVASALWAVVTSAGMALLLSFFGMIPEGYLWGVMLLSLVQSLSTVMSMLLLGNERIRAANMLSLAQFATLALFAGGIYFFSDIHEVWVYLYGLILSFAVITVWGFILVLPGMKRASFGGMRSILGSVVTYGAAAQTGNFLQLLNYRLSFYLIKFYSGIAALGVFSVGVQISEGLWIIPRSMSLVQFTRISNTEERSEAVRLTLLFAKIAVVITAVLMSILLLLPSSFFMYVFGPQFSQVRLVLLSLAIGIVMFSLSVVISPYFSGTGRPHVNTAAAAVGLLLTLGLGFILVPRMGITGAGITSCISYSITALFQLFVFVYKEKIRMKELLIGSGDIQLLKRVLRRELFIKSPDV